MSSEADLDLEIVQEFLVESHENLDQLDQDLVALEQNPGSRELLASIFRTIHTIKGTSGFLAFGRLEKLTHAGENLLSRLRDGVATMTPEAADVLLRMVDLVRAMLADIERRGTDGDADVDPIVAEIMAVIESPPPAPPAAAAAKPAARRRTKAAPKAASKPAALPVEPPAEVVAEPPVEVVAPPAAAVAEPPPPVAAPAEHAEPTDNRSSVSESSIRVDVELLEQLVRLAGELVLARNQILQRANVLDDETLGRACHRLNLVASELQESVMRTRMQPIDNVWAKLPRVVRDLSSQLGRKVRLEMEGGDTELDRTLLEAIKDPLTHLVRNAIDHGVEEPAARVAAGKPETGVLRMRAAHEGGQILVEVGDDGKGIDPARIAEKALANGLINTAQRESMTDAELLRLVFVPGFSMATQVTNVSGRGVGMDVVRTNIERIGGSIDVDSEPDNGTTWRLRIPLTLAIVPALTVLFAGQRYAIPQVNLLELVRLDGEHGGRALEDIGGAQVYRLRDTLLPVIHLGEVLGVAAVETETSPVIAVLESDGRNFGLVVDRVLDTEEIVVKPLCGALKEIGLYAGATILGDGRVSLILDVQSFARRSIRVSEAARELLDVNVAESATADEGQLLIVSVGAERHIAIPLDMVTRLEEFAVDSIERVGRREVVRHRGAVLPLIRLSDFLGTPVHHTTDAAAGDATSVPGVVYTVRGRSVALLVSAIVDIVSAGAAVRSDIDDAGLIGSAVLHDRVTELLDVRAAVLAADPAFFTAVEDEVPDTVGATP
ncbi:MAG TPA: chemotaxis protein CheW [Jatrophihabitans sp.]|nr:chemotaxis protein CheW [Jatrophihabitans sp.]